MKAKRLLSLAIAVVLMITACAALSGCSDENKAKYTVGICQLVQHEALDAATQGFKDALTEKLGKDVAFQEKNAAGDSATCATIANQFVSNGVDLIMANATPALQAAASATGDIPIVATSITDYATALEISNWTGNTGMNITGTADSAPSLLKDQAGMIKELFPDVKKVGIVYNSGEANSKYQADEVAKHLKDMGIASKVFTTADSNDIASVVTAACNECDVLYIPTDNSMASSAEIVNNIAEPAGVPIVAGEAGLCKGCGVATLSIDYYSIGYKAGEMACAILVDGADPAEMNIEYASDLTKQYVASRCKTLGVTVPDGYTAIEEE